MCHYIRSERPRNIISLHAKGEGINYESRGYALVSGIKNANLASKLTGYGISRTEGAVSMGGLLDWVIRECGIPCLSVGCTKVKDPRSENGVRQIYALLRPLFMCAPVMFSAEGEN